MKEADVGQVAFRPTLLTSLIGHWRPTFFDETHPALPRCWKLLDIAWIIIVCWSPDPMVQFRVHSFVDPPMLHPKYQNWGQDVHPRGFFDFLHRTHRQRDWRDSIYTYLYSISILIFTWAQWAQWAQWALTCIQFQWLLIPCQGLAEKLKPPKTGKNKKNAFLHFSSAILCHYCQGLNLFHSFFLFLLWSWSNS